MKQAVAIELNPVAVKDMKYNIVKNKVSDRVIPVLGDVNKVVPKKFRGWFDRIVMPMPKGSETFLVAAIVGANPKGCVIHFYAFVSTQDPFSEVKKLLKEKTAAHGFSMKILEMKKVRSFSKEIMQAVFDVKVWKKK